MQNAGAFILKAMNGTVPRLMKKAETWSSDFSMLGTT